MTPQTRSALIAHLGQFVTDNKKEKIESVLSQRTRHITIALEDIYQSQNASATIRTADCMGLQDVFVIENYNEYEVNPDVTLGSSKWVDIHRFSGEGNNTQRCYDHLKAQGYHIVATALDAESLSPTQLPLDQKLAIVFGNEEKGISDYANKNADTLMKIPMFGFTQSFNISVSVAITLTHLVHRLHQLEADWHLSEEEKQAIILRWYRNIVDRSEIIEKNFLKG